jgi:transposase
LGLLLTAIIHPANVQDRDGVVPLRRAARRLFPFVTVIFADGAYQGETTAEAVARTGRWRLEIVKRSDSAGFVPLPKRWIVERTFAWLGRCRRLAKDVACPPARAAGPGGEPCRQCTRLPLPSHDPAHAAQARKERKRLTNFADRWSDWE